MGAATRLWLRLVSETENEAGEPTRPFDGPVLGVRMAFIIQTSEGLSNGFCSRNGKDLKDRTMTINEVRPRSDKPRTGGGKRF